MKSVVYQGNSRVGEVEIYPRTSQSGNWVSELRVSHFSPPSERCPPLAILHTVASGGICFKMESRPSPSDDSPLRSMHAFCLRENKTAVVLLGDEELHLVAMTSRNNALNLVFWGFKVALGLYNSCLTMLNLRCLGIVFDLDETLIVANTTRTFEDRIDALQRKVSSVTDPQRVAGMLAEIKRYQDDRSILKQYAETDQVVENGKVYKVQSENVPPLSDNHQMFSRPIIRLQEKNIILTRINPSIRDTSVLVRLRPAWDDLRSYLTARGRKRFEVYVCTMAERDYALEMWRLLDPDSSLISSTKLLDRIVCVKAGSWKSLLSVFQDGSCHPGMALVIDDRLRVWDEKDQSRVHVVPAFSPYYAPQAETNSPVPVLCVARNVACNVRGGFFKDFDEGLLPRIGEVLYEDEVNDFPSVPDVGNYLISEDDTSTLNGNKNPLSFDGMADAEVGRRLKEATGGVQAVHPLSNSVEPGLMPSNQQITTSLSGAASLLATCVMPLANNQSPHSVSFSGPVAQPGLPEPTLQGSPATEEGEVPESELDPDTRRRLLILQHGQDTRDPTPPFPAAPPLHTSATPAQSRGNWFQLEEEMNARNTGRPSKGFPLEPQHASLFHGSESTISSDRIVGQNQRFPVQQPHGDGRVLQAHASSNYRLFAGAEMPIGQIPPGQRNIQFDSERTLEQNVESPAGVLQDIAMKCGSKVEFRTGLCDSTELQFSIEVWFVEQKIGEGVGRTRKEAQHHAAEVSIRYLANKYLSSTLSDPDKPTLMEENGFLRDSNSFGYPDGIRNSIMPARSASEESHFMDQKSTYSRKNAASVAALKDLCIMEGFNLVFQAQPSPSDSSTNKDVSAQVEIAGQILGKGIGKNWEEAKMQAADEALGTLRSMLGQFTQKRSASPRSLSATLHKRLKPGFSRALQRITSSGRYPRNETPVP